MASVSGDIMYGRAALREHIPWIVPESLEALEKVLRPDWRVFEWGSGGSTIYWAKHCAHVCSVEHNSDWLLWVSRRVIEHNLTHKVCSLYLRKDKDANTFHEYADAILTQPDQSFDLVFVDGEASCRGWCLRNALPKLKPGGYLLLDNSNWLKRDLGPGWERQDFVARDLKWIGQKGTFDWWTSIVRKVPG